MKISLLHPSRGRAKKAKTTYDYWMEHASGEIDIEHIISVDESDLFFELQAYGDLFSTSSRLIVNNNSCVVEATNHAAKKATGDILIYLSDDFKCPDNWDELLVDVFKYHRGAPKLLKVDDCLQPFNVAVLTIPIMNRELYDKLGYFWHPGYKSMFVDEDLYWTCLINEYMLFSEDIKFAHEHNINGFAERDDTYIRSEKNWDQGKAFFAVRKEAGFAL